MNFTNCYEDELRAEAYAGLEFAGTYHLAFRDLPAIFRQHARGTRALDFGCGTGRSTRFLKSCGFDASGIDISQQMVSKAKEIDPAGDYRVIPPSEVDARFDLILSAFTFDNVRDKEPLFRALAGLLAPDGVFVNIVSTPDIYMNEWASFTTRDFVAENRKARSGDIVRIITTDYADARPVEDIVFSDASYRELFSRADLSVRAQHLPLAHGDEQWAWKSEKSIAPWSVYVLGR